MRIRCTTVLPHWLILLQWVIIRNTRETCSFPLCLLAQSLLLCRTFTRIKEVPYKVAYKLTVSDQVQMFVCLFSFGESNRPAKHLKGILNSHAERKKVTDFFKCTNRILIQDAAGHMLHSSMSPCKFKSKSIYLLPNTKFVHMQLKWFQWLLLTCTSVN